MLRLKEKYKKEVIPAMVERFGCKNIMAVPKVIKVVINTGFGRLIASKSSDEQKKIYEAVLGDLALISGQRPILKKAKKSISSFKVREGMFLGATVVLRREKMYDFLDRLIHIAIPRTRDFRGIDQKSIDQKGNLTYGIKEHIIFPEISLEKVKNSFGLEVTVVTSSQSKAEGLELLRLLGFPIKS